MNPLADDLFVDIALTFRDIEMTPLSPYSGNYVGYLIEKGKMNLALDYKVEDNQLKATNKIFLDQFSLGEPVESEEEGMCFMECANGTFVVSDMPRPESACSADADDIPATCDEVINVQFVADCAACQECKPDWFESECPNSN